MVIETRSPEETQEFAERLAANLTGTVCIALSGDLGAGKTTLVRGLVAGWGGDVNQVSSPTYVLLNCYQTPRGPVYHLDAYRVTGPEDFDAIGFEELLESPGMVILEWPERVQSLLPSQTIKISIKPSDLNVRLLTIA